jgi:hypothetical protein
VEQEGDYYLLFGASLNNASSLGSVLIREVQLELSSSGKASNYSDIVDNRKIILGACPLAGSKEVQNAFTYRCDDNKCFYELQDPILLLTVGSQNPSSKLSGKLAAGNYNYRHISVALNMVGTALVDCQKDPTLSCFGSGFLEYTLEHDGFNAPVVGHDGNVERFNFGKAYINHGKALTAEKYITLPLSSADAGLLSQPSIEKPEFRGRPLDGSYRLKIWDRPGLTWEHLQDIQIVLRYRYWSTIVGQPQTSAN